MFRYTDYLFGNETEAQAFAEAQGWEVCVKAPDLAVCACGCLSEAVMEWLQFLRSVLPLRVGMTRVMRLN